MPGLGHIAVGVAAGRLHTVSNRFHREGLCTHCDTHRGARTGSVAASMIAFSVLSMLPDIDVLAFSFGIPYGAPFGHRGASHSVVVGLALGLAAGALAKLFGLAWGRTTALACLVAVSHGLLDTLTYGGRGVAVLWPFSNERFFSPWRPIPVSPIGPAILSEWGLRVLVVELLYFSPLLLFAFWPRRRPKKRSPSAGT